MNHYMTYVALSRRAGHAADDYCWTPLGQCTLAMIMHHTFYMRVVQFMLLKLEWGHADRTAYRNLEFHRRVGLLKHSNNSRAMGDVSPTNSVI